MAIPQKISAALILVTIALLAAIPDSVMIGMALLGSVSLFGFLQYLDRNRIDHVFEFDSKVDNLQLQIKSLRERIDIISIGKGMGR